MNFICKNCCNRFAGYDELKRHERIVHSDEVCIFFFFYFLFLYNQSIIDLLPKRCLPVIKHPLEKEKNTDTIILKNLISAQDAYPNLYDNQLNNQFYYFYH